MPELIKVYTGSPSSGGTDGTLVTSGTDVTPVETGAIKIPTTGYEEGDWVKLAVRCSTGYETVEEYSRHVRISIEDSGGVDKWQINNTNSTTGASAWGDPYDLLSQVDDTNTIFYARGRAAHTEIPIKDRTVKVDATALIGVQ